MVSLDVTIDDLSEFVLVELLVAAVEELKVKELVGIVEPVVALEVVLVLDVFEISK